MKIPSIIPITKKIATLALIIGPTYYGTRWIVRTELAAEKTPKIEMALENISHKMDKVISTQNRDSVRIESVNINVNKLGNAVEKYINNSPNKQDMINFLRDMKSVNLFDSNAKSTIDTYYNSLAQK
jgi:hypothetical protein